MIDAETKVIKLPRVICFLKIMIKIFNNAYLQFCGK